MSRQPLFAAVLVSCAMLGLAHAERATVAAPARLVKQATPQTVRIPATDYEVASGSRQAPARGIHPPPALLKAIVTKECDRQDLWRSGVDELKKVAESSIRDAYAAGFTAGQEALVKDLPAGATVGGKTTSISLRVVLPSNRSSDRSVVNSGPT